MDTNNEIVISGIAGKFPESQNVQEFMNHLFGGLDLVTENDRRFKPGFQELPKRSGTILEADKFDNVFFGIPHIQVNSIDVRHRILLETVYECIIDAGINPKELRGSKTGVYVALSCFDPLSSKEYFKGRSTGILGALAANRISYVFDFKGPSFVCDTTCSSSFYALVNAYKDLLHGEIDNAVVASANLNFQAYETLEFSRAGLLATDGICKTFSCARNGYVRSEAIVSILLQKKTKSRRIYASIIGGKLNCDGYKKEGAHHPSSRAQYQLLKELYNEFKIDINDITYFETHGTGTIVGDETECKGITKMFMDRREPLLIGSLKSNMGHSEMSSGLCSLVKALLIFQTSTIPANIHFEPIDQTLPGIKDKKLMVVTRNTKLQDGLIGINCFGVGGANGHVVLKGHSEPKQIYTNQGRSLVLVSGRTTDAVDYFLEGITKNENDLEMIALVNEIHKNNIDGHNFRGYMVTGNKSVKNMNKYLGSRPIVFVYSGMGSQWKGMGNGLLKIHGFKKTFDRCAKALKNNGVNLCNLVTSTDESVYANIANCFMAINATQIALTDVLYSIGIIPDVFLGHSLGELACAYADGNMTPEDAVMLSYGRGIGFTNLKTPIIEGQMAVIGLSKEEVSNILPDGVYIACDNSSNSVTISGPEATVTNFVTELQSRKIFAKTFDCCRLAHHTEYINEAAKNSFEYFKKILSNPQRRSEKWISTSVGDQQTNFEWSSYNSAEYHYNNICNTVLFRQALKKIPDNAIVVEIGPHGVLQSILKRELSVNTTIIPLLNKNVEDYEESFLSALGKIYTAGGQPQLNSFYGEITFPVSQGTAMISPLIKWDHSLSWLIPKTTPQNTFNGIVTVNLSNPVYSHLRETYVNGRMVMPVMSYVVLVWKVIAEELFFSSYMEVPVIFENISFKRITTLSPNADINFFVNITKTGYFEIHESDSIVVNGQVKAFNELPDEFSNVKIPLVLDNEPLILKKIDFYKHYTLRGQIFGDYFKKIIECNIDGSAAKIEWSGKFDCFLENIKQLPTFQPSSRHLIVTTFIDKIVIDPEPLLTFVEKEKEVHVTHDSDCNITRCLGISISGLESTEIPVKENQKEPVLEKQEFIYYKDHRKTYSLKTALEIALQIALQNSIGVVKRSRICHVTSLESCDDDTFLLAKSIMAHQPLTETEFFQTSSEELTGKFDIILVNEHVMNDLDELKLFLSDEGFVVYHGCLSKSQNFCFEVIFECKTQKSNLFLLRSPSKLYASEFFVKVSNSDFNWIENIKSLLKDETHKLICLYTEGDEPTGILGLIRCICTEEPNVRAIIIEGVDSKFDKHGYFYKTQLAKNLTINVLRNGQWGTFVHFPFEFEVQAEATEAAISINNVGDLSSLNWIQLPPSDCRNTASNKDIQVFYSGINFEDVMSASEKMINIEMVESRLEEICLMGYEYAGVSNGCRLMGLVENGAISLQVQRHPHFTWEVPVEWSLENAATIPVAYAMSYYALRIKGHLRDEETVLINLCRNPIGLAAITVAQAMKCIVFVIVSTDNEKEILIEKFPLLAEDFVVSSKDEMLVKALKKNTKNKGVHVILDFSNKKIFTPLNYSVSKCLLENGHYIQIDLPQNPKDTIPYSKWPTKNFTFHRISLPQLFRISNDGKLTIQRLIQEGLKNKAIRPLPKMVFEESEVEYAFRHITSEKFLGKILIQVRKESEDMIQSPRKTISAVSKIYFNPNKSYVIIGGTGGIGLELADWMIRRGAKKIILNSRSGITTGYQMLCLHKWSNYTNVSIEVNTDNTTTISGAELVIGKAKLVGPVGGIFNMTLVLRDNFIRNQTAEDFEIVLRSKLVSASNLDLVSRRSCPDLDHFVVYSSVSAGRGSGGLTNYGMANSAMEQLCEKRRSESLPGLAIQWGPIGGVGLYETAELNPMFKKYLVPQSIRSCLVALEKFMLQPSPVLSSVVIKENNEETLCKAQTPADVVKAILGIADIDSIDKSLSMVQLGVDSLMAAEIKQNLYKNFKLEFGLEEITDLTFAELFAIK